MNTNYLCINKYLKDNYLYLFIYRERQLLNALKDKQKTHFLKLWMFLLQKLNNVYYRCFYVSVIKMFNYILNTF